jgi:hypothetical protein
LPSKRMERTVNTLPGFTAAHSGRVCRAWHRTCEVKVLTPGVSGAEGKEKGRGVIVRWGPEEAQSKSAGRRTETGYEVWYVRGERARDREALHP